MLFEMHGGAEPRLRWFQVLGERSSGTNYISVLIRRNLELEATGVLGWKHGFPQMTAIPAELLVISTFREPVAWVRSMYARPWHSAAEMQRLRFSEFLRAPWDSRVDRAEYFGLPEGTAMLGRPLQYDRDPATGEMFANLVRLRTAKARGLLTLPARSERVVLVAFEKVLADPEGFVARIAEHYGLERRWSFRPIGRRLGQRFKPAVADRVEPPEVLDSADLAFLRAELDAEVEARLGYPA